MEAVLKNIQRDYKEDFQKGILGRFFKEIDRAMLEEGIIKELLNLFVG